MNDNQQSVYSISSVSTMTGVNSVTLRAWERRYGLIKPQRTESGHRVYSNNDIEHIKNILKMLDSGIAISRVKDALGVESEKPNNIPTSHWLKYTDDMLRAVYNFDELILDSVYNEAMSLYPVDIVTRELLLPLLEKLGQRWMHVITGIAEEHFFSSFMRNKLGARFHHRNQQNTGPQIVAACLPGEQHEFGLLLLSLAAHARGYRIILLGADMPLNQLAEVVHRSNSNGIILSGSHKNENKQLTDELIDLVRDSDVPVFIGGKVTKDLQQEIEFSGSISIGEDITEGLQTIGKHLPLKNK